MRACVAGWHTKAPMLTLCVGDAVPQSARLAGQHAPIVLPVFVSPGLEVQARSVTLSF